MARGIVAAINAAHEAGLGGWIVRTARWFQDTPAQASKKPTAYGGCISRALCLSCSSALYYSRPRHRRLKFNATYDPSPFPGGRGHFVLRASETHHIFAEDQWGDFLIYHLYPSKQVFIDGRSDFYGDDFGVAYLDVINVQYAWEKTLDKYDIDTIAISPRFALASTLKISRDWRVVFDDGVTVVFRRAAPNPSRQPGSLVSSNEGNIRDRVITKTTTRDRRITQPNLT